MPRAQRKKQIEELESLRGRRVISYVTGDRQPNLGAQIAPDVFPLVHNLLAGTDHAASLDLFIYSTGGMTMAAWGLMNILREFADSISVLIPYRALSTATLIALGANEIVMSRLGQLSPVDPSVNTPFNPPASQAGLFLPVSVEDVRGFLDLAREEVGLKDMQSLASVFSLLAADVKPMALGNVYREKEQIKLLTEKLLRLHIPDSSKERIGPIVETFTRKLFSHDYLIGRREAKDILGPEVVDASPEVEKAMMGLFDSYASDLELNTSFVQEGVLGKDNRKVVTAKRAYVESSDKSYLFRTVIELRRVQPQQPMAAINLGVLEEGWIPDPV